MATNSRLEDLASLVTMADDDLMLATDVSELPFESKKITKSVLADQVNFISSANATDLTDMGDTNLHYHTSDRNNANQSGSPLLVSGAGPIIDVQDTDLTNVVSRISGADGILSLVSDINRQAANSLIELGFNGRRKFSVHNSIAGHDLLNVQFGDSVVRDAFTMSYILSALLVSTTPLLPDLKVGQEVVISNTVPSGYNGTFPVLVVNPPGFPNSFTYTVPDYGIVTTVGDWYPLPTCLIFGGDLPTAYSGLLDAVTYGSIFLKITATGINQTQVYTVGQDGAGDKIWKQLAAL